MPAETLEPVVGGNQAWTDLDTTEIHYEALGPGNRFYNTSNTILIAINNNDDTSIDITVNSVPDTEGRLAPEEAQTVTLAPGEMKFIGPLPTSGWNQREGDDKGYVTVTYSADVADVYVAALELGTA